MRIVKAIVPQWQELNQVLIRQGESNEDRKVFIIHKGEFLVTRKIQNAALAIPSSQPALVKGRLKETKLPV